MPFGAAFRFLFTGRSALAAVRTQYWDTRRLPSLDVGSGYGVSVDDGDLITNVRNLVGAGAVLTQATSGDRPTVDTTTIPGATLIETINDDHLAATVSGQLLTLAVAFRDDGASTERVLVARDTSEVTNKAAFDIGVIVE